MLFWQGWRGPLLLLLMQLLPERLAFLYVLFPQRPHFFSLPLQEFLGLRRQLTLHRAVHRPFLARRWAGLGPDQGRGGGTHGKEQGEGAVFALIPIGQPRLLMV